MLKTIVGIILIASTIIFIYPIGNIIIPEGIKLFFDNSTDGKLIKGFGKAKIESYERYEKIGTEAYSKCYAIYFNKKQANAIENQINSDENWTRQPFNEKIINNYKKFNVNNFENLYYYLIEFDKDYNTIETNREILDNKPIEWYKSAIYDTDSKTLYYYYKYYQK